jgi:hypothetical protein
VATGVSNYLPWVVNHQGVSFLPPPATNSSKCEACIFKPLLIKEYNIALGIGIGNFLRHIVETTKLFSLTSTAFWHLPDLLFRLQHHHARG